MVDKSISMNINEVLELEYLNEEISRNIVNINKEPGGSTLNYVSRESSIFEPESEGTYELEINNQIIEITVYDFPNSGVSHWSFEQTLDDVWDNGSVYNGTANGSIKYSTDSKQGDYSLELNGSDAYVTLGSDIGLQTSGPFSIAGWVKMNESPDRATMLSGFGSDSDGSAFDLEINCYNAGNASDTFGVHTWSGYVTSGSNSIATQGNWGHYVATYSGGTLDGSNISLYVDGNELQTEYVDSNNNNLSTGSTDFEIGMSSKNSININLQSMNIDSVRSYNKELSASEVSNLYNNGSIS